MKIVPQGLRSFTNAAYATMVARVKREGYIPKPATTKQCASTEAILGRDPSKDAEHQARPDPTNWKAVPNAETQDEAIGMRQEFRGKNREEIESMSSVRTYRTMQRRDDRNSVGQPDLDGYKALRGRAVDAFMAAKGTGRTYSSLTAEERASIRDYLTSSSEDLASRDVQAKFLDLAAAADDSAVDKLLEEELTKVL